MSVLKTDGAKTHVPRYAAKNHADFDSATANDLTSELCISIKATGIKNFTVAFDVTGNGIKNIRRHCTTSPTNVYDADDADEPQTTFANIGKSLSLIHIAR